MTDFTECGFGAITPELILRSLIGCIAEDGGPLRVSGKSQPKLPGINLLRRPDEVGNAGQAALKIEFHMTVTTSPVHCGSFEDFQINLQRALVFDPVYGLTLRININWIDLDTCGTCQNAITWWDYFNALFGEDSEGLVYLNVFVTNEYENT